MDTLVYSATPTGSRFHLDNTHERWLVGPVGCFPGDTEFLTPSGWKRLDAYEPGDQVAVVTAADGTGLTLFQTPERYIDEPATDWCLFTKNRGEHKLIVSDDHRFPVTLEDYKSKTSSEVVMDAASIVDLLKRSTKQAVKLHHVFTAPVRHDTPDLTDDEVRFLVALAADGANGDRKTCFQFGMVKQRKVDRLTQLLDSLGYDYTKNTYVNDKYPTGYTKFYVKDTPFTEKQPLGAPLFWKLNQHQLEVLVEELVHWDGSHRAASGNDATSFKLDTTRKIEADFVQYAGNACGYRTTCRTVREATDKHSALHEVLFINSASHKYRVGFRKVKATTAERYASEAGERKYCFTVSTGMFIVRQGGHVYVTSNCGKTVAGSAELFQRMMQQAPHPVTGRRQTRWLVIRQSYPQLVSTVIKTWMQWFGQLGTLSGQSPITWKCEMRLPDNSILDSEILFYAMSDGFDTPKLRSLEVTGALLSEFAEIDKEVLDVLFTRLRYPKTYTKAIDGYDHGPTWMGVFGESNAPSVHSHWYERFEQNRPTNCAVFKYPGALIRQFDERQGRFIYFDNPLAENIATLPGGFAYYHTMIGSMSDEAIDNLVLNNYGKDMSGKPVFPAFRMDKHVIDKASTAVNANYPVIIGIDPGLNAAAVLGQTTATGALMILDEITTKDILFETFIDDHLLPLLRSQRYLGAKLQAVVDPAGLARSAMAGLTPIAMLQQKGIATRPAITNNLKPRIKAVEHFLGRDGRLLISSGSRKLIEAMDGGYRYAKVRGSSSNVWREEPEKNEHSHVADAMQYVALEFFAASDLREARDRRRATDTRPRQRARLV